MSEMNGQMTIRIDDDMLHWDTKQGVRFIGVDEFESLAAGAVKYYFVDTSGIPSNVDVEVHMLSISVDSAVLIHQYKNPTISDNGTLIPITNANMKSTNTNYLKIYADPTITDNGTEMQKIYVATSGRAAGILRHITQHRIVNPSVSLLIGIENINSAAIDYASVVWDWKEEVIA